MGEDEQAGPQCGQHISCTDGGIGRGGASGCTRGGLPPERRSVTGLQPHVYEARVPVMLTALPAWRSKAGCKPALLTA